MLSMYIFPGAVTNIEDAPKEVAFAVVMPDDTFMNDTAQLMQAAANTTATILSLAIADGLSRYSDTALNMLVLNTTGDGNVTCALLD